MAGVSAIQRSKVMQVNLNHCAAAQDLMVANAAQWGVDLAVIAEPYFIPHGAEASTCGSAVALVPRTATSNIPLERLAAGEGWVAVQWGDLTVVSAYVSPRHKRPAFERILGALKTFVVQCRSPRILVLGDFNSKSTDWGCPEDKVRGRILRTWVEGLGLRLLNQGSEPTCVRSQGASVVDVTFATLEVAVMTSGWRVLDEETLSDHRYITFDLGLPSGARSPRRSHPYGSPRWALRRLDRDALRASVAVSAWAPDEDPGPCPDVNAEAAALRDVMYDVSDACMPRAGTAPPSRRAVYWWSTEIQDLRNACLRARHQWAAARRPFQGDEPGEEEMLLATEMVLREEYREARETLSKAIAKAKYQAWESFLGTLEQDPWEGPYRMVRKKLRPWAPPVTESLDPQFLDEVVSTLFPGTPEQAAPRPEDQDVSWSEELGVTEEELGSAMARLGAKDTAPGPDGVHGKVWYLARSAHGNRLRRLFDACLSRGELPSLWRRAKLVLLRKEGRPADQPSAYRPICLLDEVGKLFERIIVNRLVEHLSQVGPDLAESQYGFREGRSTIDAIERVRSLTESSVARGGVALAISFDIANAFNTLPWTRIGEALRDHAVPPYLRRVLGSYLSDRWVEYPDKEGRIRRRAVYAGVPQGSVLGPTLWNLGYNKVLRAALPPCVTVVCYADDTLLVATGADWVQAHQRADVGARLLVSRISALGLRVDLRKTEALWFHGPRRQIPAPVTQIRLGEAVQIRTGAKMKYLGLFLDGTWAFRSHFDVMVPRIRGAGLALGRLLPNKGGPGHAVRRLYLGVLRSMGLYGAPVWARDLRASPQVRNVLLQMGRRAAQRVARCYRTVSSMAAHVLGGVPPFDLLAEMYAVTYRRTKEIRQGVPKGVSEARDRDVEVAKAQAWRSLMAGWQRRLADYDHIEIVRAIRPVFEQWLDGCHGLTFWMSQVLTGHGCFGEYLHRIKRETSAQCRACNSARDTAAHTLLECPAWAVERGVLRAGLRIGNLSLPAIVKAIAGRENKERWQAFATFCREIMGRKEAAEREREYAGDPEHGPLRRRKRRRRGPSPLSGSPSSSGSSSDGRAAAAPGAGGAGVDPSAPAGGVQHGHPPRGLPRDWAASLRPR